MSRFLAVIGILCITVSAFAAPAGDTSAVQKTKQPLARDTYYKSGYYLGLNMGRAKADMADKSGYGKKEESGFASSAYFGYDINHYLAVELGYLYLPTVKYTDGSKSDINISNHAFATNIMGKYPVGEGFSVYAKLGGALVRAKQTGGDQGDQTQNATVLAYGGGIDYVFANVGGLHLDLDYYHTNKKDTKSVDVPAQNIATIGIRYQF